MCISLLSENQELIKTDFSGMLQKVDLMSTLSFRDAAISIYQELTQADNANFDLELTFFFRLNRDPDPVLSLISIRIQV